MPVKTMFAAVCCAAVNACAIRTNRNEGFGKKFV